MIEIFILSFIQGVTEFLPVSSSSHLIILSNYINFENQSLSIDVSLHIGSFLAVIVFFRNDIINFMKNKELFLKIIVSSLPVMIIGFFLVKSGIIDKIKTDRPRRPKLSQKGRRKRDFTPLPHTREILTR